MCSGSVCIAVQCAKEERYQGFQVAEMARRQIDVGGSADLQRAEDNMSDLIPPNFFESFNQILVMKYNSHDWS